MVTPEVMQRASVDGVGRVATSESMVAAEAKRTVGGAGMRGSEGASGCHDVAEDEEMMAFCAVPSGTGLSRGWAVAHKR